MISEEEGHVTVLDTRGVASGQGPPLGSPEDPGASMAVARRHVHDNAVFNAEFTLDDERLITASGDRTAKIFDTERLTQSPLVQPLIKLAGHSASVRCARPHATERDLVATAGRDGHIILWDTRAGGGLGPGISVCPLKQMQNAHMQLSFDLPRSKRRRRDYNPTGGCQHGVTSVQWLHKERMLLSAGASDGCLKLWDLRFLREDKGVPEPLLTLPVSASHAKSSAGLGIGESPSTSAGRARGLSHVEVSSCGRLISSCLDDSVYVHRLADLSEPPVRLVGHKGGSFYVRAAASADGRLVASGSVDAGVFVWALAGAAPGEELLPSLVLREEGPAAEVSVVRWGRGFGELLSIGDDGTARLWGV